MKYFRTGKAEIDEQLNAIITFSKQFFGLKITAIYLLGSYIDNTAIKNSDIDIAIIYDGKQESKVKKISAFFSKFSRSLFKKEIDLYLVSLDQICQLDVHKLITRESIVNVKIASQLIDGKDIRNHIQIPTFETYLSLTLETPFHFMAKARDQKPTAIKGRHLNVPHPRDYFYGYLSSARDTHRTIESKPVLTLIGWICTALIAMKAKKVIGKKSDVCKAYELYIHDEWTSYVKTAYQLIRTDLDYQLPKTAQARKKLRDVCSRLVSFENHFIAEYDKFYSKEARRKNKGNCSRV